MAALATGGTSTIVAAGDGGLITWGPSPTFGELGYGEGDVKSSTKPKLVSISRMARQHFCGFHMRVDLFAHATVVERVFS